MDGGLEVERCLFVGSLVDGMVWGECGITTKGFEPSHL